MPSDDAVRWNQRYRDASPGWFASPRSFLLNNLQIIPQNGLALDLAMGIGANSSLLIKHGLNVVGIDISSAAVFSAKSTSPDLLAVIADLTRFYLPPQTFDVVLDFYYLQRNLWPDFARILKPNGILFFETLTKPMRQIKPEMNPEFLLEPGELAEAFKDWDILQLHEGLVRSDHGSEKVVASLIARLPAKLTERGQNVER